MTKPKLPKSGRTAFSPALFEGYYQSLEPVLVMAKNGRFPHRVVCRFFGHNMEGLRCSRCSAENKWTTFHELQLELAEDMAALSGIKDLWLNEEDAPQKR